jgi:hypothetical protein
VIVEKTVTTKGARRIKNDICPPDAGVAGVGMTTLGRRRAYGIASAYKDADQCAVAAFARNGPRKCTAPV